MKHITIGIIAHVDAGKTTLSESLLYESGVIRKPGRVDSGDTLLDSDVQERQRGITIFSKQAEFSYGDTSFTLLDTPGHVDFAAEMERTLQVLDYAVLVISASDGVQAHTRTLWRLLRQYDIPTFIFVNKMDQPDNNADDILKQLKSELSESVVGMCSEAGSVDYEEIAISSGDEQVLDYYMEQSYISEEMIAGLIMCRKIFPCYFGSALKSEGVTGLMKDMDIFTMARNYEDEFGARVYKITRDDKGNRLTHIKVMGGLLKVRDILCEDEAGNPEKVNQIRIYNGAGYEVRDEVSAGYICTVTGPVSTYAGQGLGFYERNNMELIEPVISYRMRFDQKVSPRMIYPMLKQLEEELPELKLVWDEDDEGIYIKLMGQVQIEILTNVIKERFGAVPEFDKGRISYKETIADTVIGVGHFEPLRHYAEVHLKIEPGEPGSGIEICSDCSEDVLDRNWQRLIMTHLKERNFVGVAVGGQLTDVKFTVINGRAHNKHTEGGDFRQATYRAVRQGLMEAETVVLEPYYNFILDIPDNMVGRAMTDIENRFGTMEAPVLNNGRAIIKGYAPVATLRDYQINVNAYTSGTGSISVSLRGYAPCHNQDEVINESGYDAESDMKNPSSSVFCTHGSGFIVPWDQVKAYMHVFDEEEKKYNTSTPEIRSRENFDYSIGLDEIETIFAKTFSANKKEERNRFNRKRIVSEYTPSYTVCGKKAPEKRETIVKREKMLLVDGYNVIFGWDYLAELARDNMDAAKDKLISVLSNYQAIDSHYTLVVFDGYKVKDNRGSEEIKEDIHIVYTKEGETADSYIERYTHDKVRKYDITVATGDGLIQTITRGNGCRIVSPGDLYHQIEEEIKNLRETYGL